MNRRSIALSAVLALMAVLTVPMAASAQRVVVNPPGPGRVVVHGARHPHTTVVVNPPGPGRVVVNPPGPGRVVVTPPPPNRVVINPPGPGRVVIRTRRH
ncbi:MAG: hypothetical protein U0326_10735 [Polyangiales bacterium]